MHSYVDCVYICGDSNARISSPVDIAEEDSDVPTRILLNKIGENVNGRITPDCDNYFNF